MKKSTQNDWEKQFSKKFTDNVLRGGYGNDLIVKEAEPIMNFIRQLLADARKEVIREVEKIPRFETKSGMFTGNKLKMSLAMEFSYNKLLDRILATLRKETK